MGLKSEEQNGTLVFSGGSLKGTEIIPEGDPAVAMACSIAALSAQGQTRITGSECVDKSYPGFFTDLAALGAIIR